MSSKPGMRTSASPGLQFRHVALFRLPPRVNDALPLRQDEPSWRIRLASERDEDIWAMGPLPAFPSIRSRRGQVQRFSSSSAHFTCRRALYDIASWSSHHPFGRCQDPAEAISPAATIPPCDCLLYRDREAFIYSPPSFRKDAVRPRGRY